MISFYSTISSCQVNKHDLRGWDFRLFQDTEAWSLAKAVRDQDTMQIEKQIKGRSIPVDFQEEVYGQSLLHLAVENELVNSSKKLLSLGANPNHTDISNGDTPMHNSVGYHCETDDTTILALLIKYGGDPNGLNAVINIPGRGGSRSVLFEAASKYTAINRIKYLVEKGADVNFVNSGGWSVIANCLISKNYDVVLYLLQSGKLQYKDVAFINASGEKQYLQDMMRDDFISLESPQYKYKLEVIDFLKKNGIDYRATPIPENIIERAKANYPDTWQDYLSKY